MPLVGVNDGARTTQRTTQRILGLLFYLVGVVYAGWMLARELGARGQSVESLHWPGVSGEITTSDRQYRSPGRRRSECTWAEICFRYAVADAPHASCRATFLKSCSASTAAGLMTQYPVGAEVTVFYDPRAPDEAVLVPGSWHGEGRIQTDLLLLALFGVLSAFGVWRLLRPPEDDAAIGDPPAPPPQV